MYSTIGSIYIYIPEKGQDESQRKTNMVVQDLEEKIAEHLLLNVCSFRGACINLEYSMKC